MRRFVSHIVLLFFGILSVIDSFSQSIHDTIALDEVDIIERIVLAPIGSKAERIDSVFLLAFNTSNLSDIIMLNSPIYIKSYGCGGLSTPSFRGTSANHTQVLWNGIKINSPMLGQMDFSLIPVFFLDDIHINYGSASLQETSGGLGGSINLINEPEWNNRLNIESIQSLGSFENTNTMFKINIGSNNLQSSTKIFHTQAENNFKYRSAGFDTILERKFSNYKASGLLQEIYWKANTKNIISGRIWLQSNYRNLPANITIHQDSMLASQKDETFKSLIEWKNYGIKYKINMYIGYVSDNLNYINNDLDLNTLNRSNTLKNQIQFKYIFPNNIHLNTTLNYQYFTIHSDNYKQVENAGIFSFSSILNGTIKKNLSYSASLRYENFNLNQSSGLMPLLGLEYYFKGFGSSSIYLNLSENHRFPTMNELFWNPGGNKDLKPEESKSFELGFKTKKEINTWSKLESNLSYYNSMINNWIAWMPVSASSFEWTPINYKMVYSRGLEAKLLSSLTYNEVNLRINIMYNLAKTTNKEVYEASMDNSINKQLVYIPEHIFHADIILHFKNIILSSNYTYTDKRYIYSNESAFLPAYHTVDFNISKSFMFNEIVLTCELGVKNINDVNYQSIVNYPMPGRHYIAKLILRYKDEKH